MASQRKELAKDIRLLDDEIKELESKRARSQAYIIEALVNKVEPDETELQFFRQYTAEIEVKRERLADLTKRLKAIL